MLERDRDIEKYSFLRSAKYFEPVHILCSFRYACVSKFYVVRRMKFNDKNDLKDFLKGLCGKFCILRYETINDNGFSALIQCKWKENKDSPQHACKYFIEHLSSATYTHWLVKSRPSPTRFEFRKTFMCRLSAPSKAIGNKLCESYVDFTYKKINKHTIRNDEKLKQGLNVVIKIIFSHNHGIDVSKPILFKCNNDTKLTFFEYFNQGMTPMMAKYFHELNTVDLKDILSIRNWGNCQINLNIRQIRYVYDNWKQEAGHPQTDMTKLLKDLTPFLNENGVQLIVQENPYVAVIITPIMKRLFLSDYSNEIIYVDSSGSCVESDTTTITFVFAIHKIGAIPLACILHTARTEANFTLAFTIFKKSLEKDSNKIFEPQIIITEDCTAERNALKSVFLKSTVLLSTMHICISFWRFIFDSKQDFNINKEERLLLMKSFKKMLYAETKEQSLLAFREFISLVPDNDSLQSYLKHIWCRRNEWFLCKKTMTLSRGNNMNDYIEASIRIFKAVILPRIKVFNSCALAVLISDKFETYQKLRLLNFAILKQSKNLIYDKFLAKTEKRYEFIQNSECQFLVNSDKGPDVYHTTHTDIGFCDCLEGKSGSFCRHLCALEMNYKNVLKTSPRITKIDKIELVNIALGTQNIPESLSSEIETVKIKTEPDDSPSTAFENSNTFSSKFNAVEDEKYYDVIYELNSQFTRITDLLRQNYTSKNMTALSKLLKTLSAVETEEQAIAFITTKESNTVYKK